MKTFVKKSISVMLVIAICISFAAVDAVFLFNDGITASAIENNTYDKEDGLGVPPEDELDYEEYSKFFGKSSKYPDFNEEKPSSNSLASKCDLSAQSSFPDIRSQGGLNSCTSWATTYYQFTYEAYKNKEINIKNNDNFNLAYSPAWTFNFTNNGTNTGCFIHEAFEVLEEHGALKLSDYPYNSYHFDYGWANNVDAMIGALNLRITNYGKIDIPAEGATKHLDKIKRVLYGTDGTDGHVLTFSTFFGGLEYKDCVDTKSGKKESAVYRCNDSGGGHSMTVVGYNDDIWCDINGNGNIDDGELGAFKVANSHGKDYMNSGYVWFAYDTLNANTSVGGNWEATKEENRRPIFEYSFSNKNTLYWMEVGEKEVEYVGQLTIDTDDRNNLRLYAGRGNISSENLVDKKEKFKSYCNEDKQITHKGTLVFDYAELAEPISDYISGYNWFIRLNGNHSSASFKITDNLSNTIVDFGDIDTGDSYMPISLSMGDLNYDGVNDVKDSKILFNAVYRDGKLSNLQEYLASNMNSKFPINAAVTPSGFDDIGTVLDGINVGNINWDTVPANVDLQTLIDGNYNVLFINCSSNADVDGEVIREFVEQGGTVYASDWALDSIEEAFPERNISHAVMSSQSVTGNIADKGLRTSIGVNNIPIEFDKASWRLVTSELQDDVTVYVEGRVTGALSKQYPLAFSFPYGNNGGKVFCTSFHQSANTSQEMNEFMNDLVLTINHNKDINAISEWSKENGYENVMSVTAALNSAEESASYSLNNIDTTSDFAILTNESGDVSINLTAPDGSTYTNFENGEFVTGDIETTDDEMQVYSMGKRGLSVSAPIAADNGEWSFKIVSNVSYRSSFAVAAAEKSKEISTGNYTVDYRVAEDWGSGQNIRVTITNTGDEPLRNWALQCDNFHGTVTNVWNGMLHGENIIRNAMYNSDIAPGASVTLGYTLTNADGEIPVMNLCNFRKAKQEGYSVDMSVLSEWESGFVGTITITNTTDEPIMAWELSFNTENFDISGTSQFVILENTDNRYKITGTYNGNIPIPANTSIILQFNGEKTGTPSLTDISLTEMTF